MMEDKKKSKAFPTFVLILAILFIGTGVAVQFGYLDPVLEQIGLKEKKQSTKKDGNTNANSNTTIEEGKLDTNSEQVKSLYNRVSNITSKEYSTYYYEQDKLLTDNMDNKFRLLLAFNTLSKVDNSEISEEEMKNAYANLFGKIEYKGESFDADCIEYKYDTSKSAYFASSKEVCPSTGCKTKKEEILSAYQYADRVEITTVVAFSNTCDLKYYKDYKYANLVLEGSEYSKKLLEENQDKFDHYVYTFALNEGKYIFTGVSKEV